MARPTKLTPELLEKAKTYLSTCIDIIDYTDKGALNFVNVELPTVVGLALYLGINKDTVTEWCKLGETKTEDVAEATIQLAQEFSVLVREIIQEQEKRLINRGLGGLYNPKIVGLVAAKHGYAEKTETDLTSKGEKLSQPSSGEDIAEIARRVGEELKNKKLQ